MAPLFQSGQPSETPFFKKEMKEKTPHSTAGRAAVSHHPQSIMLPTWAGQQPQTRLGNQQALCHSHLSCATTGLTPSRMLPGSLAETRSRSPMRVPADLCRSIHLVHPPAQQAELKRKTVCVSDINLDRSVNR